MANQLDFLDAQMELMAAEEALFRAESTLSQYLAEFKDLLGMGPQKKITLVKKFLPDYQPLRIKLEKACREALENNPQIRQQKLMIKLYQLDLAATKSEISPSLNLSAGYDYNKSGLGEEEYRAALFLEIPLIDGGESKTEIRIAQERVKEAELNLRKLKRDILAEVRSYFFDLKKKEKRIEFLRLSQEKHQESLDIAKKMFLEGAMTEQELREKEISLKQTQIGLLSAIVDYELIRAKLLKIMGRRL
jgi:outer membrane protein TolC